MASSRRLQRKQEKRKQKRSQKRTDVAVKSKRRDISVDELHAIIDRAKSAPSREDQEKLTDAVDTLAYLTQELDTKGTSIRRLRKMLFGSSSEKTRHVVGEPPDDSDEEPSESTALSTGESTLSDSTDDSSTEHGDRAAPDSPKTGKKKITGHGRNPASSYTGAQRTPVSHETLVAKSDCPKCPSGKVYPITPPAQLVRVTGVSPLKVDVYELERLRCNLCGEVFSARPPPGVSHA